ncbi:P pilus assembly chaperone PapD [Cupriavidus metallidurans]|jgi:fimbrial chaperone protein|uniref:fimbrial biogenesis chaperone n=1 Tax=Cupriavidus metallidurans TaxID=119219 RepID=UPI002381CDE3|nr:molecular chaperone [Cupriavidus metallidurans]MDE4917887.1 molecular chaperone [Cupriavidus metallidurans]
MATRHPIPALCAALSVALALQAGVAIGSVTLTGTRVIYDGRSPGESLQFTNQGSSPSVMQVWVDSGNEQSTPKTADAPFIVTPPVFRIGPNAGQTIRLLYMGKDLPKDRESVFYLNTLEIPSLNATYANQNQMLVMLRNRIKILYRPTDIEGSPQKAIEKLSFQIVRQGADVSIVAKNESSYHISLVSGNLNCGGDVATFTPGMIPPYSQLEWSVKGRCPIEKSPIRTKVQYVDDYGAVRESEHPVTVEGVH